MLIFQNEIKCVNNVTERGGIVVCNTIHYTHQIELNASNQGVLQNKPHQLNAYTKHDLSIK